MLQLVLHVEGHGEARAALQLTNMGKVTKHETFFFWDYPGAGYQIIYRSQRSHSKPNK